MLIDEGVVACRKAARSERLARIKVGKKATLVETMQKAPERAPAGADGLGYNVGLIPSLAPKRRAKAGVSPTGLRGERGGRVSGESASSGSRGESGERGASIDRGSLGSRSGPRGWLRGRSIDKERS